MARGAQALRIGEEILPQPQDRLGQWNDWLDQTLATPNFGAEEKKYALAMVLTILDETDEPILRHKALHLASKSVQDADALQKEQLKGWMHSIFADPKANIWEQMGALLVCWRLEKPALSAGQLATILDVSRSREEGFFLRAHLMEHAKQDSGFFHFLRPQLAKLLYDTSAYVRIRALELLCVRQDYALLLERCEEGEMDPQVQMALLHCFAELLFAGDAVDLKRVEQAFQRFYAQFTVEARTAFLMNLNEHLLQALRENESLATSQIESLQNVLQIVRQGEQDVLRRHSSLARQCLDILRDDEQRKIFLELHHAVGGPGTFENVLWAGKKALHDIAPLLTVLAYFGLGYEVKELPTGLEIRPAYGTSFSFWRFIHELKRPSGHKRQGAAHWKSRDLQGTVRIPSSLTCELVATTVPGEPLYIPEAGGWRPWLPLLCDVYRMMFRFPVLRIFTPDGVTTVERPESWPKRIRAWTQLVFSFERVSRLRNWTARHGADPGAYIKQLRDLGFSIRFEPTWASEPDVTISRFFGRES